MTGSPFKLVILCNAPHLDSRDASKHETTIGKKKTLCALKTFKNLLIAHPSGSIRNCTPQILTGTFFLPLLLSIYAGSKMKDSAGLLLKRGD